MRTTALRAIGGWAGLPVDEDIVMFAALSELSDGYHHSELTWLYRQHPGQVTKRAVAADLSEECRGIALQRAQSVRLADLSLAPAPLGFGTGVDPSAKVATGPAFKRQLGLRVRQA
jgi:hypothetical protein